MSSSDARASGETLEPSFTLVMLPQGYSVRPSPPWEQASRASSLTEAARALTGLACAYDERWEELGRELLIERVVPRDGTLDLVPLRYVEGRCAFEAWDYRGRGARGTPDVLMLVLRLSSATIAREARMIAERMLGKEDPDAVNERALALEKVALAKTRRLRLDVAPSGR